MTGRLGDVFLGHAAVPADKAAGRIAEAALPWQQVLRLAPGDLAALDELRLLRETPAQSVRAATAGRRSRRHIGSVSDIRLAAARLPLTA